MDQQDKTADVTDAAINRVISNFVKGLPDRIAAIVDAWQLKNWENLKLLSHKLAGAAIFGFPELGEAAHVIERAIEDNQLGELEQHIGKLRLIADQVLKFR